MSYSFHPQMSYLDFKQACRAYKPSELIPAIARLSASLGEPPYPDSVLQEFPPWGLAAAARENLLYGNEFRSQTVDKSALRKLMHKFQMTVDLENVEANDLPIRLITQATYEQFPFQESIFEEVARSHAWMVEGLKSVETKVITEQALADMLDGVPLPQAIGITFFLQVGALKNGGLFNPSWLDQPNFTEILAVYPRANIEKIAARITTTPERFREDFNRVSIEPKKPNRYDYNPLVSTPFVDMGDGIPVAPATRLILRTVSPGGLYYAGMEKHGNAFAEDLGALFENYVGRQLSLIEGADVMPEIAFGKGGGMKSIDWFVVFPNLLVLVEVKSRRLKPAARAGKDDLLKYLEKGLGDARNQLARTVDALGNNRQGFEHIPVDRPILGLIVTAEPFYTGDFYLRSYGSVLPSDELGTESPVAVASARDIEMLVTHGHDVEEILLELMARRLGGAVDLRRLAAKGGIKNSILKSSWESYPWLTREN